MCFEFEFDMNLLRSVCLHHTVIPPWIYRIPSELRSQAGLGLPSTVVGDHTGIVSAVCFLLLFLSKKKKSYILLEVILSNLLHVFFI